MSRPPRGALLALASGMVFAADAAHAHTTKGIGDFHAGFLHPMTAPEHVIAFVALGILASQMGRPALRALPVAWIAAAVGAIAALWVPMNDAFTLVNILSIIAFGSLIALAWGCPPILLTLLLAITGLTHGLANGSAMASPIKPYLFIPGFLVALVLAVGVGIVAADAALERKVDWMKIAVRVSGSWIAAVGILVLAANWKSLSLT